MDPTPPAEEGQTRDELVRELADVVRALSSTSTRVAHAYAEQNRLRETDFRALMLIHESESDGQPLTASELGHHLGLSSAGITYMVERLVGSGHVRRDSHPTDRRKVVLRYADHGHEVATAYFRPLGMHMGRAIADATDEDVATTNRVLRAVVATFDAYADRMSTGTTKGSDRGDRSPSNKYTARDSNPEPAD